MHFTIRHFTILLDIKHMVYSKWPSIITGWWGTASSVVRVILPWHQVVKGASGVIRRHCCLYRPPEGALVTHLWHHSFHAHQNVIKFYLLFICWGKMLNITFYTTLQCILGKWWIRLLNWGYRQWKLKPQLTHSTQQRC